MAERVESALPSRPEPSQAELLERVRTLEHALQVRDDFLAVAAHELRNPMHSLLLQITAALHSAKCHGDLDMQRRLERIKNVVDRYVKRATVLLDACRYQVQRIQLHAEACDLTKIVTEIVESFEAEAVFNRVELRVHAPDSLPGRWDRLAVEQIGTNLISNAIKYGAGGAVDVLLELKDAEYVSLSVRDQGVGIAPEDQARIFEQFERAVAVSDRRSGFGLGLWLVRSLVNAHGGSIELESEVDRGATFTVTLPRHS